MNLSKVTILIFLLFAQTELVFSQEEVIEFKDEDEDEEKKDEAKIQINFSDDDEGQGEESFRSGMGRLFDNSTLASGLALGSEAINRSIETFMELIFYSLLDRDLSFKINDDSQFTFKTRRDLFPTPTGSYVVVDRFAMGPEYNKLIGSIDKIPVNLGADGKVNLFDIYLRNDGMRVAEQDELPFWRVALNNWLGILPLLSVILPPSFNPNELYDPINLIETPFSFPLTVGGFKKMPIDAIRSYNVSGAISLPIDFSAVLPKNIRDNLDRAENLKASVPYTVFVEGEYRINVLRKSYYKAWVGLTKVKRLGHQINTKIANALKALVKVSPWWGGIPLKFIPLDAMIQKAKAKIFNQLYEFDLRNSTARKAYRRAVMGDFAYAHRKYNVAINKGIDTGVRFHFTRHEDANEGENNVSPNLIFFTSLRADKRTESEIEILDDQGRFFVLEGKQETRDEFAEILTGKQEIRNENLVEMNVIRLPDPKHPDDRDAYVYAFKQGDENPYQVVFSQWIQDRFTDSHEYRGYISRLKYFSKLKLNGVPEIPRRDQERIENRRKNSTLANPMEDHYHLHVTPTYLGRFGATAAISMSTKNFQLILDKSDEEKWAAFAEAYGLSADFWKSKQSRRSWRGQISWVGPLVSFPLKFINIYKAEMDFISEANNAIDSLHDIKFARTPLEKLAAFYDLFNTRYPSKMTRALLLLSDVTQIPRSVSFFTKSKGKASKKVKKMYKGLNNKVIRTTITFPPPRRARVSEDKLNAFFPNEFKESRARPSILKIEVDTKMLPNNYIKKAKRDPDLLEEIGENAITTEHVYVNIYIKNLKKGQPAKLYVKADQAGKIQVGKFVLSEKVLNLLPVTKIYRSSAPKDTLGFEFYLTGPLSPISGPFFKNAITFGGTFEITLSASQKGKVWSDERTLKFNFEDGVLSPP